MRGAVYGLLLILHILLVVSWLGVDAGVFIGSHMIRNRAYEPGGRFLVSRLMAYLDLGPRLSVPLTFAVGLNLAVLGGWATLPVWLVVMTWAAMLAWCAAIVYAFVLQRRAESGQKVSEWLRGYRRLDLWARWAWIALIALALAADISGAQVFKGLWLNGKVALFMVVILLGQVLRLMPGTSSMALMAQIHHEGSTPEREAALYTRLERTYPLILGTYLCVVAAVFLGVLKPGV
jgi:hypothetical protein